MYCRKCGNQLEDGDKFCRRCGAQIYILPDSSGKIEKAEKEETSPKHAKRKWIIVALGGIALVVIAAVMFFLPRSREPEKDDGSGYSRRTKYAVMNLWTDDSNNKSIIMDPNGNVLSEEGISSLSYYMGDNGVLAGVADGSGDYSYSSLFIIRNGEYINITDNLDGNSNLVFQLCGSGKKLFYRTADEKIYVYDTETGESSEIYEGAYLDIVSYNGNVVAFSDGYCKIGDKEPFWGQAFASYEGISDSGKHMYFNESYHRTSGDDESDSVNFGVFDGTTYRYDNNMPLAHQITESESVWSYITAHNADYSEILFNYDGDTFYYNDNNREKTLVCMDAFLYPVEGIRSNRDIEQDLDLEYYLDESFVANWKSGIAEYYDPMINVSFDFLHSVDSVSNHIYCVLHDDGGHTVSLVYMDSAMNLQTLVDDVTADPVISKDGKYLWTVSGNSLTRINMTGTQLVCDTVNVNGLTYYTAYGDVLSLPIVLSDDGRSAFFIGDVILDYDLALLPGTLYFMDFEQNSGPSVIDENAVWCESDGNGSVYYLADVSQDQRSGTAYFYSAEQGKKQLASDVRNLFAADSQLFITKLVDESEHAFNLYRLDTDMFRVALENFTYANLYQN